MKRSTAFALLMTDDRSVIAHLLGITRSAVDKWPDELPRMVADKVIAAKIRLEWRVARERFPGLHIPPIVADALHVETETSETATA